MRQIAVSIFLLFVVVSFFSCKKNKNGPQKKICHGSFVGVKPVSLDYGQLSGIDEKGMPKTYSEFPPIRSFYDYKIIPGQYRYICYGYNKKDSCVYYLAGNDTTEDIYLYKYNMATKQTEMFTCTNPKAIDYMPDLWYLYYNSFTNEFYIGFYYIGTTWYVNRKIKLTITGHTFSAAGFSVQGLSSPQVIAPSFIDEQTGDMYFHEGSFYFRYSPITGETTPQSYTGAIYGSEFNPNDGKVYGFNSTKQLVRLDPKTGVYQAYGFLDANTDSITGTTFDVCNNQYIFCKTWNNVLNIYWVDVASGKIAKQVATQGDYFSLIHIPQTQ